MSVIYLSGMDLMLLSKRVKGLVAERDQVGLSTGTTAEYRVPKMSPTSLAGKANCCRKWRASSSDGPQSGPVKYVVLNMQDSDHPRRRHARKQPEEARNPINHCFIYIPYQSVTVFTSMRPPSAQRDISQ
jgi:hypothetical protein